MYLLNNLSDNLSDNNQIEKPIYTKPFNNHINDINIFNNLIKHEKNDYKKKSMLCDLNMLKSGILGEKKIDYELKNSRIPMLILHDLRLEYNGYKSQIDFIAILNNYLLIMESKNLNGDLELTYNGDFIRYMKNENGDIYKKECLYNPITQNLRHIDIIKDILQNELSQLNLDLYLKPIIVLTNYKNIINDKYNYCQKNNIIRCDKLIPFILNLSSNTINYNDNFLYQISNTILKFNIESKFSYKQKYINEFNNLEKMSCIY